MRYKILSIIFLIIISGSSVLFSDTKLYDKALELYDKSPSNSEVIIPLLEKQLENTPEHIESVTLLGNAFLKVENFEDALIQFDKAHNLLYEKGELNPELFYFRTLCLYNLRDYYDVIRMWPVVYKFCNTNKRDTIDELYHSSKLKYISYSKKIIKDELNYKVSNSYYIVIDITFLNNLRSDKDIGFFLNNIDTNSESIIVIILDNSNNKSFCIAFNKTLPKIFTYVLNRDEKPKDVIVKTNLINIEGNYLSLQKVEIEDTTKYELVYVISDNGDSIEAFYGSK